MELRFNLKFIVNPGKTVRETYIITLKALNFGHVLKYLRNLKIFKEIHETTEDDRHEHPSASKTDENVQ